MLNFNHSSGTVFYYKDKAEFFLIKNSFITQQEPVRFFAQSQLR